MEMLGTTPMNLDKDFVQDESIEPLWPIHGGNPESREKAEWIFDDNLIALLQECLHYLGDCNGKRGATRKRNQL